jgi:hypothetical protein
MRHYIPINQKEIIDKIYIAADKPLLTIILSF